MKYFEGIGRRKRSTARVRIFAGDKTSTINNKPIDEFFGGKENIDNVVNKPLIVTGLDRNSFFIVKVMVEG